jgi:hypothetical protein
MFCKVIQIIVDGLSVAVVHLSLSIVKLSLFLVTNRWESLIFHLPQMLV